MAKSFKKSSKYKKVTVTVPAKKTGSGKHKAYKKTVYKLKKK